METKNKSAENLLGLGDSKMMTKIRSGDLTIAARLYDEGDWRVEVREKENVVFAGYTKSQGDDARIVVRVGERVLGFDKPEKRQ